MIIGLTGTKAGGKGVVAEILKAKGFLYSSLSDRVREEAVKRGLENCSVKELQDIGNELREKFGLGILAKRTLGLLGEGGNKNFVIDGIRNLGEIEELAKNKDFVLIAVDAPQKIRFERLIARKRASDPKTFQDFLIMDKRDLGEGNESGQQVAKCIENADYKIYNHGNLDELREKINKLLNKLN